VVLHQALRVQIELLALALPLPGTTRETKMPSSSTTYARSGKLLRRPWCYRLPVRDTLKEHLVYKLSTIIVTLLIVF